MFLSASLCPSYLVRHSCKITLLYEYKQMTLMSRDSVMKSLLKTEMRPEGILPVGCERTTQIHMEVLQIFESYCCLYINEEDPQGYSGEADPSFCTQRQNRTIYIISVNFSNLLHQSSSSSHRNHNSQELYDYKRSSSSI